MTKWDFILSFFYWSDYLNMSFIYRMEWNFPKFHADLVQWKLFLLLSGTKKYIEKLLAWFFMHKTCSVLFSSFDDENHCGKVVVVSFTVPSSHNILADISRLTFSSAAVSLALIESVGLRLIFVWKIAIKSKAIEIYNILNLK